MKVPLAGGPISTIATVSGQASGATWTPGDTIVFGGDSGLMDVPASGGTPRLIAKPDTGETFTFPDALPDGHAVLFGISGHGALKLAVLDRRTNQVKRLRQDGGYPRYVNGRFVVLNDRTGITSAVPFDTERLEVTGAATSLAEKLGLSDDGDRNIGVSRTGDFAYQVSTRQGVRLIRVSRAGGMLDVGLDSAFYALPTVSPDGRRVAITRSAEDGFDHRDVWVLDLTQGTQSRVTFDTLAAWSIWSPDGRQIAYMKVAGTPSRTTLLIVPADGSGAPRVLLNQPGFWRPAAFEPGGRNLLFHGSSGGQGAQESIWRVGVDSGATPQQVLASPFSCNAPSLSPDGKWLTYATTESGRSEVYVRSYPGPGGRWQVSLGGGTEPIWSPAGNEIFYRGGDAVMAAAVRTQPSFEVTSRTRLFTGQYIADNPGDQDYAVAPDGKSFYMLQVVTTSQQAIVVTLNLFEQLRARRK
jgi:Tol biopolymer transport system component